ncbi:MAG TPA: hypothetical protein VK158_04905 [Acidobacteriota bacterium]|nr:hypothetical protein [Acidobacteriota bacterium]
MGFIWNLIKKFFGRPESLDKIQKSEEAVDEQELGIDLEESRNAREEVDTLENLKTGVASIQEEAKIHPIHLKNHPISQNISKDILRIKKECVADLQYLAQSQKNCTISMDNNSKSLAYYRKALDALSGLDDEESNKNRELIAENNTNLLLFQKKLKAHAANIAQTTRKVLELNNGVQELEKEKTLISADAVSAQQVPSLMNRMQLIATLIEAKEKHIQELLAESEDIAAHSEEVARQTEKLRLAI